MKIIKTGSAGTLESSDVLITVRSNNGRGVEITLSSTVEKQFGKQIRSVVLETLRQFDITEAAVDIQDKGALDCAIQARLIAAAHRAAGIDKIRWEEMG